MTDDGSRASAVACKNFYEALQEEGFDSDDAVMIVAAWMSRPLPSVEYDAASLNAILQNFADTIMERNE